MRRKGHELEIDLCFLYELSELGRHSVVNDEFLDVCVPALAEPVELRLVQNRIMIM